MKITLATMLLIIDVITAGFLYPTTMQVVDLDYNEDVVTVQTATGFTYQFDGTEDYAENDLVSCLMWSGGTEDITDDLVLAARYSGFWIE